MLIRYRANIESTLCCGLEAVKFKSRVFSQVETAGWIEGHSAPIGTFLSGQPVTSHLTAAIW